MKSVKSNRLEDKLATILTDVNNEGVLTITIEGRLDSATTGTVWRKTIEALGQQLPSNVVVDASKIDYCNGSGISLLVELQRRQKKAGKELDIRHLRSEFKQNLDFFDPDGFDELCVKKARKTGLAEETGRTVFKVWEDIYAIITFVGELCVTLGNAALHPGRVRWKDAFLIAETGGVNALPIIALVSFLIGLIMAFQAAIPMRQFGAEIFVADLIALSVLRELGPLMTGIILAGRTSVPLLRQS